MESEISKILEEITSKSIINYSDIPNIDLYVDQVTTYIEQNLFTSTKDKSLTKSMINNYCKNGIIPPSDKKKYNKNHILLLILLCNTKSILQINDFKKIFENTDEKTLLTYYSSVNNLLENFTDTFDSKVLEMYKAIEITDEKEKIKILATQLSIEANYKKLLAEQLIEKIL
ncbi:MAG: DUF1836 domain-containing protein [Lachnospirales bacterium]